MKRLRISLKIKKRIALILHLLFLSATVAGISILYWNPHFGAGLGWLINETYEMTPEFTKHFRTDIEEIFQYIEYIEIFETDHVLDPSKPMVRVMDGYGQEYTYTLDEMIHYARTKGMYLNEKFKIDGPVALEEEDEETFGIGWRAYDPDVQYEEPSEAMATLGALSEEVLTNLGNYYVSKQKFMQNPNNLVFRIEYKNTETEQKIYTNSPGLTQKTLTDYGNFLYMTGNSLYIETNMASAPKNVSSLLANHNPYETNDYYIAVAVDTSYPQRDSYWQESQKYENSRRLFLTGIIGLAAGLAGCLLTLGYLIASSGRGQKGGQEVLLLGIDRIPAELYVVFYVLVSLAALYAADLIGIRLLHLFLKSDYWSFSREMLRLVALYLVALACGFGLLRRYKAGVLWSKSLVNRAYAGFCLYFNRHSFLNRDSVCYLIFLLWNFVFAGLTVYGVTEGRPGVYLVSAAALSVMDIFVFYRLHKNASMTDKITAAVYHLSEGDTTYKIDTAGFDGKERDLADTINHISGGLESVLLDQIKSERLKADLITNVSHDIKTPLTSIINYVDLIKRENIQDPKILGYLEILDQKSQRLKNLTEDLVEASKASSGNLKLDIADIDFVELIHQTNGEFEEKFQQRNLELVSGLPDREIIIEADGRRMWRVLENLYNNAVKYAMEHSRVYVDVEDRGDQVAFTVKNVSESPLNIDAAELTERFVRGDVARTTEGSGLGLSIAKSLTNLQKGKFEIYIDGDLFKVEIVFPIKAAQADSLG